MGSSYVISTSAEKLDRKTLEKNRRIKMKLLCSKLFSLLSPPHHHQSTKKVLTQQDQVDQAITYIEELKERVEVLKRRKEELEQGTGDQSKKFMPTTAYISIKTPMVEVRELDSILEVILTCGLQKNFTVQEVIKIIEQEGAQVVTADYSTIGDTIYYTIHAQVKITRLGIDASSVHLRLQMLVS
ncbi:transcription factor like [Capsicum chacoense]